MRSSHDCSCDNSGAEHPGLLAIREQGRAVVQQRAFGGVREHVEVFDDRTFCLWDGGGTVKVAAFTSVTQGCRAPHRRIVTIVYLGLSST